MGFEVSLQLRPRKPDVAGNNYRRNLSLAGNLKKKLFGAAELISGFLSRHREPRLPTIGGVIFEMAYH